MRKDTDEHDEAHYSRSYCPLNELVVFWDHTITEHKPRRITIDSYEEKVAIIHPSSHQSRILHDRKDVSSISEGSKSELHQRINELADLFNALFRR
ncbi:hypothetical protein HPULCUR_010593 [Helicostylum pulchrum]|uniref:Uncharacterized protein n=1 Tax=Helicostylum pulchrum TaxID=562976 RepID=A0ABP9YDN8_9FUNG